jgi:hypothetical protein
MSQQMLDYQLIQGRTTEFCVGCQCNAFLRDCEHFGSSGGQMPRFGVWNVYVHCIVLFTLASELVGVLSMGFAWQP